NAGAAYVFFFRNGPLNFGWIERAYLKASNPEAEDWFGWSVAVFGNTVVVGAVNEGSNATGVDGDPNNNSAALSGAAYVYTRGGTFTNPIWSFSHYLKASNTGLGDNFAWSVAAADDSDLI